MTIKAMVLGLVSGVAAALSVALAAGGAQAQMSASIRGPLEVFDSRGALIGVLISPNQVERKFSDGQWRTLLVNRNGLVPWVSFYYASSNCTGQRYIQTSSESLITEAIYEKTASPGSSGKTIWGIDPTAALQTITVGSAWVEDYDTGPQCSIGADPFALQSNPNPGPVQGLSPAIPLDTTSRGFSPPFCVGGAYFPNQPCRAE
jgi:hypothetical protein